MWSRVHQQLISLLLLSGYWPTIPLVDWLLYAHLNLFLESNWTDENYFSSLLVFLLIYELHEFITHELQIVIKDLRHLCDLLVMNHDMCLQLNLSIDSWNPFTIAFSQSLVVHGHFHRMRSQFEWCFFCDYYDFHFQQFAHRMMPFVVLVIKWIKHSRRFALTLRFCHDSCSVE